MTRIVSYPYQFTVPNIPGVFPAGAAVEVDDEARTARVVSIPSFPPDQDLGSLPEALPPPILAPVMDPVPPPVLAEDEASTPAQEA